MARTATQTVPMRYLQGIAVPETSVNPQLFFGLTRRHVTQEHSAAFAGLGNTDNIAIRKSDIISEITVRLTGTVTVVGAGVSSTAGWPYNLLKRARFQANGQSNLINADGVFLKARDIIAKGDRSDRGVAATIGGVARTQGTMKLASEDWGFGANGAVAAGAYPIDLLWTIPIAEDQVDLAGAIFCATTSTDLSLQLDWAQVSELFTGFGGTAPTLTVTALKVVSTKYSIPVGPDGQIVVPDLSLFHQFIQSRTTAIANGTNESILSGQGIGKVLTRVLFRTLNGATPAPLSLNATNYGRLAWRYAGNETPDEYTDGQHLRMVNERMYDSDLGGLYGIGVHEFAHENALRDVVDLGTTSEARLVTEIPSGVALVTPALEYAQESIFSAGAAA